MNSKSRPEWIKWVRRAFLLIVVIVIIASKRFDLQDRAVFLSYASGCFIAVAVLVSVVTIVVFSLAVVREWRMPSGRRVFWRRLLLILALIAINIWGVWLMLRCFRLI
jgi:hypothetical protein